MPPHNLIEYAAIRNNWDRRLGTFTDIVAVEEGNEAHHFKLRSTPMHPAGAIVEGVATLQRQCHERQSPQINLCAGFCSMPHFASKTGALRF
ncbi:MAG TPA: hydantoinase/oxoprolinase N-terminal domain-containing protein [Stellaceae bacterium]|nr:hydantoinase/oxoprolinase N-terminal domain-containing protein [Stellaceae bacterium]